MRFNLNILFFSLVALSLSCHRDSNPVSPLEPESGGIIPLRTGNQWIYLITSYDTIGRPRGAFIDTNRITKDTLIGSAYWFNLNGGLYVTNKSDGVWYYDQGNTYKMLPSALNDSVIYSSTDSIYIKLVSQTAPVLTPAGRFTAYKYELVFANHLQFVPNVYYYVPNIGLVESDAYSKTESGFQYKGADAQLLYWIVQ